MLEGEYLNLVNQLQEKFNKIDKENNDLKRDNLENKKIIMTCYGILRIVDITLHHDSDFTHLLIQNLRAMVSEVLEEWEEIDQEVY
tara:strand:+ start:1276 stop:1533 length:258 start_codon:yes stop_codon:yes gene_type:complete